MRTGTRHRLLVVALVVLALAAAYVARDVLRRASGTPDAPAARVDPDHLPGGVMDETAVRALLPHLEGATWVRYDPIALVRVVPDQVLDLPWPEHAGGTLHLASNDRGFREDAPTPARAAGALGVGGAADAPDARDAPGARGARVLVLGDSHTFGLVENRESFANLIEVDLQRQRPQAPAQAPVEVINAGVSGTGPYESRALLGLLLAELAPDVVVFVLYAGNDFLNAQAFADYEAHHPRLPMPLDAQQRLVATRGRERERMSQATNQVHSFRYRPGDDDRALAATLQCLFEMAQYCDETGTGFLVAVLPSKEDTEPSDLGPMQSIRDALMLCDEDFAVNRRLAVRSVEALAARGVPALDLLPSLSGHDAPMFWKRDHHLDVHGHRAVSRALLPPVRALLDAR